MYNVIIADDEPSVLEGLEIIIDWEKYGFKIVNTAKNGKDAIEKIRHDRFNLLITDIRMPVLDGIDLIKAVHKENPNIRIIVISGYSDFTYAKKAMEYGVKGYLLKPIDCEELIQSISKIKEELDAELSSRLSEKENKKVIKDKFLFDFVNSSLSNKEIQEKECISDIIIPDKLFGVALIEIENLVDLIENGIEEAKLTMFSVRNIVEEIFEQNDNALVYQDTDAVLGLLLFGDKSELAFDKVKDKLESVSICLQKYLKVNVTIGYGGIAESHHALKKVRKRAKIALERKFVAQDMRVLNYEQVNLYSNIPIILWDPKILFTAIESRNCSIIKEEIETAIMELKEKCVPDDVVKAVVYNILFGLMKIINNYNGDSSAIFDTKSINDFMLSKAGKKLTEWLLNICMNTSNYISDLKSFKSEKIINHVVRYIETNFFEDLSLKHIAGIFYMNPVYLGRLFKNTTGETFNDYLNKVRIAEVKKIIISQDYKMLDVIEKVGYKNAEYFYKLFKRYEDISFQEYKDNVKKMYLNEALA